MNKIKEFRTQLHLTQKDLATLMNTTQQTIGRWENGTSEPSLSNLRDLAIKLGTTTSALLGEPLASKQSSFYHLMFTEEHDGFDGFWGHIGILPSHRTLSTWYPITLSTVNRAAVKMEECIPFMFESLNNKLVFINPKHVKRFVTLDEAGDPFPNDFEVTWDEAECESPELFEALEIYMQETFWGFDPEPDNSLSDNLRSEIEKLIEENNLDEESIIQLTNGIRIFYADGSMETYTLYDFGSLLSFYFAIDTEVIPKSLVIENGAYTITLPLETVALVEFPLIKFNKAMKDFLEESASFDEENLTDD